MGGDNHDGAIEAYEKAKKIIPTGDKYFYLADALINTVKERKELPADMKDKSFRFNGVREEERFKKAIERAKKLIK